MSAATKKNDIDFVIIGAAKSGTTSLYHYFRAHPSIFMPASKEQSFFSNEAQWRKGKAWYLDEWYRDADPRQLWGEASPQHMFYEEVPERIREAFPRVKLIATLRNPIDRAYSHYKHACRLDLVHHSLDECMAQTLTDTGELRPQARTDDAGPAAKEFLPILEFGEYGRILTNYQRHFAADHMRVIFFETWQKDPQTTVEDLWQWLGVDVAGPRADPRIFERTFNKSGKKRFPELERRLYQAVRWANSQRRLKDQVLRVVPKNRIKALLMWISTEANVKPVEEPTLDPAYRRLLAAYYRDDVKRLEDLLGRRAPWPEFSTR